MPLTPAKLAAEIYRDFIVDGVPASGKHRPIKADIRTWGLEFQNYINTLQAADGALTSLSGLALAADKGLYATAAETLALYDLSPFARTLLDDLTQAAARTTLGLTPGTDVQAFSTALNVLVGLVPAADRLPYYTGAATSALTTLTAFIRTLLDDVDAAAARTTLGAQTLDTDLTAISNFIGTDLGFAIRDAEGVWVFHPYASQAEAQAGLSTNRTMNPLRTAEAIAALGRGAWIDVETLTMTGATVETTVPWVLGYDYRFILRGVNPSVSAIFNVAFFGETAGVYTAATSFTDTLGVTNFEYGEYILRNPRKAVGVHTLSGTSFRTTSNSATDHTTSISPGRFGAVVNYATPQGITKLRFSTGSGVYSVGTILVQRR